ncbi:hypothetical protein AB0I54_06810 [Streptomyces sp. NPDC050625]|uniref:hypothetical protein n=1 Tax=Streptomyces sp. NPDC050625 TaxID=3154629 RepID=UPI0034243EAD
MKSPMYVVHSSSRRRPVRGACPGVRSVVSVTVTPAAPKVGSNVEREEPTGR